MAAKDGRGRQSSPQQSRLPWLVTGGTGFIGSFLVERLLEAGAEVRVPSRGGRGFLAHVADKIEWREGDLRDPRFSRELCEGVDALFHLASHRRNIAYHRSRNAQRMLNDNVAMSAALIEGLQTHAFRGPVVFFSTVNAGRVDLKAKRIAGVFDGYIVAKAACEKLWQEAARDNGWPLLIIRPVHVYGPRDRFSADSNVVPALIARAAHSKDHLDVWGSGHQEEAFIYVEDLVRAVWKLFEESIQGIECIHPPDVVSIGSLAEKIRDLVAPGLALQFDTAKPEGVRAELTPVHSSLRSLLWTPLDEGLKKTVEWWRGRANQRVLIIIPTFNEAENIGALVDRIFELHPDADILVMDDSPMGETEQVVLNVQRRHGEKLKLRHRKNARGRGSAVLEGFRYALEHGYDLVFEMDADFSHDPRDIGRFMEKASDCDVVVGSRYIPGGEIHGWNWRRKVLSFLANTYARFILGVPISDYTTGFRCYTRRALAMLDCQGVRAKGYVVLSEVAYMLHRKGAKFSEVPTVFINRRKGKSNMSVREMSEGLFSVLRIRFQRPRG